MNLLNKIFIKSNKQAPASLNDLQKELQTEVSPPEYIISGYIIQYREVARLKFDKENRILGEVEQLKEKSNWVQHWNNKLYSSKSTAEAAMRDINSALTHTFSRIYEFRIIPLYIQINAQKTN